MSTTAIHNRADMCTKQHGFAHTLQARQRYLHQGQRTSQEWAPNGETVTRQDIRRHPSHRPHPPWLPPSEGSDTSRAPQVAGQGRRGRQGSKPAVHIPALTAYAVHERRRPNDRPTERCALLARITRAGGRNSTTLTPASRITGTCEEQRDAR